jgi:hypothetical protein
MGPADRILASLRIASASLGGTRLTNYVVRIDTASGIKLQPRLDLSVYRLFRLSCPYLLGNESSLRHEALWKSWGGALQDEDQGKFLFTVQDVVKNIVVRSAVDQIVSIVGFDKR